MDQSDTEDDEKTFKELREEILEENAEEYATMGSVD